MASGAVGQAGSTGGQACKNLKRKSKNVSQDNFMNPTITTAFISANITGL
jgi:hypothetical protein